jgi:serine/threonine-protein kinase
VVNPDAVNTVLAVSTSSLPVVGRLVDSYRIVAPLGEGGCGSVWLAEHEVIGMKVAIKILRPEVCALPGIHGRFITEARATSAIASPYVSRYLDIGQLPSGESYAIMEYLDGETVGERLSRAGAFAIDDALTIARQAADALACAHDANIVHRDIKPDNIFLAATVKLLDFGIAKLIGDVGGSVHRTETGLFLGTLAYCAPEQMLGSSVGPAADIYALGATLFEMLTGTLPIDGEAHDLAVAKLSGRAPRLCAVRPDLPAALDELVASMLAADPKARPLSMRMVLAELDMLVGAGGTVRPVTASPRAATRIGTAPPAVRVDSAPRVTLIVPRLLEEDELLPRRRRTRMVAVVVGIAASIAVLFALLASSLSREAAPSSTHDTAGTPVAPAAAPAAPVVTPIVDPRLDASTPAASASPAAIPPTPVAPAPAPAATEPARSIDTASAPPKERTRPSRRKTSRTREGTPPPEPARVTTTATPNPPAPARSPPSKPAPSPPPSTPADVIVADPFQ